jgi:hypothetical protein
MNQLANRLKPGLLSSWRPIVIGALVLGATALAAFAFCDRSDPTPIPAALEKKLDAHAIASAVDTAAVHRLEREAAAARDRQRADSVRAARFEVIAITQRRRADSLALAASRAPTPSDSAAGYRAAYEARTHERDTLLVVVEAQRSEIANATARGDSLERAKERESSRANRADSVIAAAVAVVRASDPPCRFLKFFGCPSRTKVAIGGVVLGAAAVKVIPIVVHSLTRN